MPSVPNTCADCKRTDQPLENCGVHDEIMMLCPFCRQKRFRVPCDRRAGRTTRTLWKTLLRASETVGDYVVLVPTHRLVDWTYDYMRRLLDPVEGVVRLHRYRIMLPNGATIEIMDSDEQERKLAGRQCHVIADHL